MTSPSFFSVVDMHLFIVCFVKSIIFRQCRYTADEGMTWSQYTFVKEGDKKVRVSDIITQPDGTSQKFVLLGKEVPSGKQVAYHIDFSGLRLKKCKYNFACVLVFYRELKKEASRKDCVCLMKFGRPRLNRPIEPGWPKQWRFWALEPRGYAWGAVPLRPRGTYLFINNIVQS